MITREVTVNVVTERTPLISRIEPIGVEGGVARFRVVRTGPEPAKYTLDIYAITGLSCRCLGSVTVELSGKEAILEVKVPTGVNFIYVEARSVYPVRA